MTESEAREYRKKYYENVTKPKRQAESELRKERKYNSFKKYVLELAAKKGMNQRMIADEVGVTEATISRLLSLDRTMDIFAFYSLCKAIGADMNELFNIYRYARLENRVAKYREEKTNERKNK